MELRKGCLRLSARICQHRSPLDGNCEAESAISTFQFDSLLTSPQVEESLSRPLIFYQFSVGREQ